MRSANFQGFLGSTLVTVMFAIVFLIIGFATPHWVVDDSGILDVNTGLWEECKCDKIDQDNTAAWFRSVQVLSSLGIFFLFVMVVCLLLILCVPVFNRFILLIIFISIAALTSVILFITMVVAGVEFTDGDNKLNYSYAFLVIAGAFTVVATVLSCFYLWEVNEESREEFQKEMQNDEEENVEEKKPAGEEI